MQHSCISPGDLQAVPAGTLLRGFDGSSIRRPGGGIFRYFLQVHECPMPNKTKVKVGKWVDTPQLEQYEAYIRKWHSFLETVEKMLPQMPEEQVKNVNLFVLKLFFLKPYEAGDFYSQFQERMAMARDVLEL